MSAIIAAMAVLALIACAGDSETPPSIDGELTQESVDLLEAVKNAYVSKNMSDMEQYCFPEAYASILRDLRKFKSASLTMEPRWVEIREGGAVFITMQWEGVWKLDKSEEKRQGIALFELNGKPLKLKSIVRGSPFGQP